ncbi:unnamed protein product [Gongylonema pulchrum]|uniref:ATPase n=1 Tax=Gongylonema pulchrum TaxID=637853 RepID=A0A183EMD5_9BILA|nr:unnamed protein product [Gongylonema pulchrum]
MKDTQQALNSLAKEENKTAQQIESKFLDSWAKNWLKQDLDEYLQDIESKFLDSWAKNWLKQDLDEYLQDVSELKKRRLDKDGLAQSANNREADDNYVQQLQKVQGNISHLKAHYRKTADATRQLITILEDHFDKCADMTESRLEHAKKA